MAQSSKGNTDLSRARVRNWTFTLNNPSEEEKKVLKGLQNCKIFFGEEIGTDTMNFHLQGFIVFKNARTLKQLKKILPRAHLEEMKGSIDDNILYCSKDETNIFTNIEGWEDVVKGNKSFSKGFSKKLTYEEIKKIVKDNIENDIEETIKNCKISIDELIPMPKLIREETYNMNSDDEFEKDMKEYQNWKKDNEYYEQY